MSEANLDPFAEVNAAKQLAWKACSDAVTYLILVLADEEQDSELRVTAAAELLQFALKGPN